MSLGQYLVDSGVVSKEAYVNAVVEQSSKSPSILEIAKKHGILNAEQIFQVVTTQSREGVGFIEACSRHGLWSEELRIALSQKVEEARPPLAQILIDQGSAERSNLLKILDEYKPEELPVAESNPSTPAPAPAPVAVAPAPVPTPAAAAPTPAPTAAPEPEAAPAAEPIAAEVDLVSAVSEDVDASASTESDTMDGIDFKSYFLERGLNDAGLAEVDAMGLSELEHHFSEEEQVMMAAVQEITSNDKGLKLTSCKDFFNSVHKLKGVVCFSKIKLAELLMNDLDGFSETLVLKRSEVKSEQVESFKTVVKDLFVILKEMLEILKVTPNEQELLKNEMLMNRLANGLRVLAELKASLS